MSSLSLNALLEGAIVAMLSADNVPEDSRKLHAYDIDAIRNRLNADDDIRVITRVLDQRVGKSDVRLRLNALMKPKTRTVDGVETEIRPALVAENPYSTRGDRSYVHVNELRRYTEAVSEDLPSAEDIERVATLAFEHTVSKMRGDMWALWSLAQRLGVNVKLENVATWEPGQQDSEPEADDVEDDDDDNGEE